jgi:glucose-6-phosphate 1-dehydrogenase
VAAKLTPPEPQAIVVFGATGDLTRRKLLPALYHLHLEGLLPPRFAIVGYSRRELSDDDFRKLAHDACTEFGRCRMDRQEWDAFAAGLSYVQGDFMGAGALTPLRTKLEELDRERGTEGRRFYYAAVPPDAFDHVVTRLEEEAMTEDARLVIEKPFGSDLESARELNSILSRGFDESQIFRIDHYLGKETVQNILVLRFANALFEPVWNRRYVDHVELTVAEDIGLEGRGRFYERTGAIRDMVQTHLFHVLTFLAMEPPVAFEPEDLRTEIVKVLRSMRPVRPEAVVLGQYEGYREESDVDPASSVETFAALRVEIENWRWAGVPFFLRTGKRLSRRVAEAHVVFRRVPHQVFESIGAPEIPPNSLSLRIQPDEGISLAITVQQPGLGIQLDQAALDFDFGEAFGGLELVEAYEHLLLEAMHGDQTMFVSQESVERAWEVVEPLIDQAPSPRPYRGETWGPPEADGLIAPRRWLTT